MKIIPIFLPYAGCKHRCVFCDQLGATGEAKRPSPEEIKNKIANYLKTSKEYEVAFYGGTFTGLPKEVQKIYLKTVSEWFGKGIKFIRVSTRPDEIDEGMADFLKFHGVEIVEIGAQSMFDDVLEASKRGHTSEDIKNAIKILKDRGFTVGVHLMVGLPGSSREKDLRSVEILSELGLDIARIHPTLVFKGAELYKMMKRGKYKPLNIEEAINRSSEMTIILEERGVRVVRLGLYIPENQRKNIAAGPYHPSFGDIVRSRIVRKLVKNLSIKRIEVDKNHESWVYGHGNREFFRKIGVEISKGNKLLFDELDYEKALRVYRSRS